MRNGGRGAQNLEAPQYPFCINAVKFSKICDNSFPKKGSEGSKGTKGSKGTLNEMIMPVSSSSFEERENHLYP